MYLFYDERDASFHESHGSQILYWLDDLGARPLKEATVADEGFLFAGARSIDDYRRLTASHPLIRDRPEEREPLLRLDNVLEALERAHVQVPAPRTWRLPLDAPLPPDLTFPLFLRTAESSWKLGGKISRVRNVAELEDEAAALRRALGWNSVILAREWLDLAAAGASVYGPVAQEVRTWLVDGAPVAWSFHYLNVIKQPEGFPPSERDLHSLTEFATKIGSAFSSRLVVADFARLHGGGWCFIEAGPGSCAGTAHEAVFKAVVSQLAGLTHALSPDRVGGPCD